MKAILEMMQNFVDRGMNVRVEFAGGIPVFTAVRLESEPGVSHAPRQREVRSAAFSH